MVVVDIVLIIASMGTDERTSSCQPVVDISLKPNNIDAVPQLLLQITKGAEALKTGGTKARQELINQVRELELALETPRETMIKHVWGQVSGSVADYHILECLEANDSHY